ncbi:hypothetical protein C8R45DRAFT_791232, partial [Mycena sanguinolenta]
KAKMSYKWYEEDIVQKYNIVMEGWTAPRFVNPSELSTSPSALRTLNEAVKSGSCAFWKMLPAEAAAREKKWLDDVAAGRVIAKHRAPRNDFGIPRKRIHSEATGDQENE